MSALARYFHASGKKVLGYDKTNTKLTTALMSEGIDIVFEDVIDEKITSLQKEDTLVIYTPAIKILEF
jgi:UDP-N-acetylmuramate--alanine ligase